MTNVLMHDSRRLVLPLDTMVDALIEFDHAHKRWPERATPENARFVPSGVVVSVRQPGQDAPVERTYSLAIIAAAIIHYCAKMRVPVPKNASKSVSITSDGIVMVLEGTLLLQRQHRELPHQGVARPQAAEPAPAESVESAVQHATESIGETEARAPSAAPSEPSPPVQPDTASAALDAAPEGQQSEHSAA